MNTATPRSALSMAERTDLTSSHEEDEMVMVMLQEHVPLSLLIDLTNPTGPESAEILVEEGAPETRWWER
jgi:hypothetical protein